MDATRRLRRRRSGRPGPLLGAVVVCAVLATAAPRPAAAISLLAVPDTLTTVHDRTRTVSAPGVLANDVTILGTVAVLDSQPPNGTVSLAPNGGYTYTPEPGFVGTDVFRYHDFDGLLSTNSTTVTITVRNAPPVAADDEESANAGRRETEGAPGVLDNDDDADGDGLQAKLVSGPSHGTLVLRDDGGFDYTAEPGFDGDDTWTYVASDGIANSAPATVTMNVSASGSTPRPSVTPAPQPTPPPTPAPTPAPTLPPLPTLPLPTLPPLPVPTLPLPTIDLPPLPLPTPTPTARPSGSPGAGGGASPIPSPSPTRPPGGSGPSPSPGASTDPGPVAAGSGGSGSGGPPDGAPGSGSASGAGAGGDPGPGGGPGGGSDAGSDADGPVFSVGGDGPQPAVPFVGTAFAGFDGIDWAVPALTLTVPGLLLMLAVLAQLTAGAIWVPVARRWLGAFGLGRRRRRRRTA
ncbi:MAG TPA: Ig-like domain-containing protein [Candidatus Limnocylindrales bacterium]|nr:Ig-like domain-containing protein [Candidatus Limnocylindrales bacterium]